MKRSGIRAAHLAEREIMALLNPQVTFNTNSASAKTLAGWKNQLCNAYNIKSSLYVNAKTETSIV